MAVITFTTDFGLKDWFVGCLKGVALTVNPRAQLVDICHEVEPGNFTAGAFVLAQAYGYFPKGTIHVAVVDPGVGSARSAVVLRTKNYLFAGPDNGLLTLAAEQDGILAAYRITNAKLFRHPVSQTFHGRDIFGPVAAHLSRGLPAQRVGPKVTDYVRLDWPEPKRSDKAIRGEVVYVDRFGNAITNIPSEWLSIPKTPTWVASAGRTRRIPIKTNYQAVPTGKPLAIAGSAGLVEIAINGGSAANELRLRVESAILLDQI